MNPQDFNLVKELPIGLGMGKLEHEEFACYLLNQHIKTNTPFSEPFPCKYDHSDMVKLGWLQDHGDKKYTLTKKALGLLWSKYSKE